MLQDVPSEFTPLELFLFAVDEALLPVAERAGIAGLIVDWENDHKGARQKGRDTQINHHTVADLERVITQSKLPVTVRVNGMPKALDEIDVAIDHGARQVMLPMARSAKEVERFLQRVGGRTQTLIQIETQDLVEDCAAFKELPWDRAFVGLNDLMISRGGCWLWEGVFDGTVERICETLSGRKIGFGGITIVGGGEPLRLTDLMREYGRLGCSLSFLRRTFFHEIAGRDLDLEIAAVQALWKAILRRSPAAVASDHEDFVKRLITAREEFFLLPERGARTLFSHANSADVRTV